MDKLKASEIIKKNNLIPGHTSKEILKSIINNTPLNLDLYEKFISPEQFSSLKHRYLEKAKELSKKLASLPKYLPFYYLINENFPDAQWNIKTTPSGKKVVDFIFPKTCGLRPSLLSLLLQKSEVSTDYAALTEKYSCVNDFPFSVIKVFSKFISDAKAIYPEENDMRLILEWLSKCVSGNQSTIFIPLCPDYAVEPSKDPSYPLRHTFESVGAGNGPVAQKILDILPALNRLLEELNIYPKIIAGIADFEAFSQENLDRVALTEVEFLNQVRTSASLFEKISGINTVMISEFFCTKKTWLEYEENIQKMFAKNYFGHTNIDHLRLLDIAKKRKTLYDRWYGKKNSLPEYLPIVLKQGACYSAMGAFLAERYENCLVLGADTSAFTSFYSFAKSLPVLYLKKYYC